jgi:dTDP-4-amino-4,6-dideoxygalactose transaminase
MSFEAVNKFEKNISEFFNSPYAVATDCCTHAIELCLRYKKIKKIKIPTNTYVSIPMTAIKLNLKWSWSNERWKNFYFFKNTNIIDAAVFWKRNGYIKNTFMCLSFQYQKHINIGKGGMILTDDLDAYNALVKMSYDGRVRNIPWRDQDISSMGYHYYMLPESASLGLKIFKKKSKTKPRMWSYKDYPNLKKMKFFQ